MTYNTPLSFLQSENFHFITTSISGCSGKKITSETGKGLEIKRIMDRNVEIALVSAMEMEY